jgi:hypothetical protein
MVCDESVRDRQVATFDSALPSNCVALHFSDNHPELNRAGYTIQYQDERISGGVRWILVLATIG